MTWYSDGTFKLVKVPSNVLNSCLYKAAKQVQLVYVLMSGKGRKGYMAVFNHFTELIHVINVQCFMVDFEVVIWTGLRQSFPEGTIQGWFCWTQAVWWKVQELWLATSYMEDEGTN
jgi:hypothetical protein